MTIAPDAPHGQAAIPTSLPLAGVSALGIVFGDIGTSPLYTLKTVLGLTGENPDPQVIFGSLSLISGP
jgi:KUP system potassium uptake protein